MPKTAAHPDPIQCDALIAGGGLVGLTLAMALAQGGLEVVVVDPADLPATTLPAFDGRCSAIASASARMYQALGLWDALRPHGQPIWEIRVTDGDSPLFLHFDGSAVSADEPLGYMFENRRLRLAQMALAQDLPGLTLLSPDKIERFERAPGAVRAELASGRTISTPVLIACDGRKSSLREAMGIRIARWSYRQSAIIVTVAHEEPHGGIAHEMFHPEGPFAILPLVDDEDGRHRSSLVWTVAEAHAPAYLKLADRPFTHELAKRFGDFLGQIQIISQRWTYPLGFQHAERYVAHRFALVGDSAHGIHPIAGQGLNMGLRDVAALAEVLVEGARLGLDLGDATLLERYQRWRRPDNTLMSVATDGINHLFSNEVAPVRLARRMGLGAVQRLSPLKTAFMQQARGAAGNLPRLLQGQAL
jgi:2-octaprenyl-6-methoxyphenol hydroxylase